MFHVNQWITKLASVMNLGSSVVTDSRRHPRIQTDLPVFLSGPLGSTRAHAIDMNRRGMAVHTTEPVAAGTLVFLRLTTLGLVGFAHVRHARATEDGHVLGLEFREALTRDRETEANWNYSQVTPQFAWDEADL